MLEWVLLLLLIDIGEFYFILLFSSNANRNNHLQKGLNFTLQDSLLEQSFQAMNFKYLNLNMFTLPRLCGRLASWLGRKTILGICYYSYYYILYFIHQMIE